MSKDLCVSIVGLGYVGIPIAVAFSNKVKTIGFDINKERVNELKNNHDRTREITEAELKNSPITYTHEASGIKDANFHIVAVPTPVNQANQPDMTPLLSASKSVGSALKKGDIVVFESTVYPGCTEEDCVPVLEKESGLKAGIDFKVGYSPERINPGDKEHTFTKIVKVVSGQDQESLEKIAEVYSMVVEAGVYKASSIKVAEASKVIENSQRDINIAFMNELSLIFHRMGIDTKEVLAAAGTKWNFLKFSPGLVGGHCIGVDPYYLTHKAQKIGYSPEVILSGRRINDNMGRYVAQNVIEKLAQKGARVKGARVTILGLTFKENCPDVRNTKVLDIYEELDRYGLNITISDPHAYADEVVHVYGKEATPFDKLEPSDAVILGAPHTEYMSLIPENRSKIFTKPEIFFDVRGAFDKSFLDNQEGAYWRL